MALVRVNILVKRGGDRLVKTDCRIRLPAKEPVKEFLTALTAIL
jgi:hypothetical protein